LIRIVTVHWKSDRWIDVQREYLERHLRADFLVYAALNEIDSSRSASFHHSASDLGDHAESLNRLAERVLEEADDDDLLVFIDGDAFPVAPLDDALASLLRERRLAAVRRDENVGDPQPHPSFCATTVGFWREIEGDWRKGPTWRNAEDEEVTDVGAVLLRTLGERGLEWTPLLRTNVRDLHPVLFGVYADLVYHHGGGFRGSYTRIDDIPIAREAARVEGRPYDRALRYAQLRRKCAADNERVSELVFERIVATPGFARELFMTREAPRPLGSL
jgi:hypothetical protein